jgi:hypothetical protein
MFYTEQQGKKSTYQNSGVHVDAYDLTGQDKNMYYDQIQEIWELDFHGFKIPVFHCNWVDAIKGVVQDKYGFIRVDINHQGNKSEPLMLEKHIAQVFYVPDTTNKRLKVVIPEKWWIIGLENAIDDEEFDQFDEIPPFITLMIKSRIPSANEALYLHNDHHEKDKNFKKPGPQRKVAKWLCKICSMCENMTIYVNFFTFNRYLCEICSMCENMAICVKNWFSLDICAKYAQCVKIWISLGICVKYAQCVKIWPFDILVLFLMPCV